MKGPRPGIQPSIQAEIGRKYGRWTVLAYAGTRGKAYAAHFHCRCDCGAEKDVKAEYLRKGKSTSCGCYQKEVIAKIRTTHGHSINRKPSRTYVSWQGMFERCYKPWRRDYRWYGGLGVIVCERWHESFENFLADMGECPTDYTIDRIDPTGNYEPGNCRWAPWDVQDWNKRKNA